MNFATRITRCPIPFDPEKGREIAGMGGWGGAQMRDLAAGAAGCSPYLAGLIMREADWVAGISDQSPEALFSQILMDAAALEIGQVASGLRQAKGRVALLCALADLGGVWSLEEVTGALTRFADLAVDTALRPQIAAEIQRGRLPGLTQDDIHDAGGMCVLAMGKMGASELNYSSDIDLICLFDDSRFDHADLAELRIGFVRATRKMAATLSDRSAQGYVFRTDLRLRPDPSVTPVCLSMEAAERYYESVGRTWERAAFIKARAAAGDTGAGRAFLERLTPFVWRRHLDFAAIRDTHDMRLKIRAHKGFHGRLALEGHNMKLGAGGIREIEFFAQTHQLITGGRDPELRLRDTCGALSALAQKGWVDTETAKALRTHYRSHREIEHRVQMINDAQTHALPGTPEGFDRLARFCGEGDTAAFRAALEERLWDVAARMDPFYTPDTGAPPPVEPLPQESVQTLERWLSYPALRSPRAVEVFERIRPQILSRLARAARPQEALNQFDAFLVGLPAGVQLFSLFESNPQLIELLVDICATSPGLAQHLSRHSGVLDAVLGGGFFEDWPGQAALGAELTARLDAISDYEKKLDEARRWAKEWHFRIGVHHLRGLIDAQRAGQHYSDLARAVLGALLDPVCDMFAIRHGPAPGRGLAVLGMGSLGAGMLNAASDLDLIVIFDGAGVETSDGPRPLATRAYYARLTQALVTALSAPMAEGRLYEVDMRLRPSGRQGPVATSVEGFKSYQQSEAWTWEHLALTRAHALAGEPSLMAEVEAFRRALLAQSARRDGVLEDVADMRRRLAQAKPGEGVWDVKSGPGGLMDIELAAQSMALRAGAPQRDVLGQLGVGHSADLILAGDHDVLARVYTLLVKVNQVARLVTQRVVDVGELGQGALDFLLRETGFDTVQALEKELAQSRHMAQQVIDAYVEAGQGRKSDG